MHFKTPKCLVASTYCKISSTVMVVKFSNIDCSHSTDKHLLTEMLIRKIGKFLQKDQQFLARYIIRRMKVLLVFNSKSWLWEQGVTWHHFLRDVIQYDQNFLKCFKISWKNVLSHSFVQGRISKISWNQEISWKITSLFSKLCNTLFH